MDNFPLPLTSKGNLWVFAYGSLMWDRGFKSARITPVRVYGWRRKFTLRSTLAWGSDAQPGLCASLHAGGAVTGRALLVEAPHIRETLEYLSRREAAYLPRAVRGRANGGALFPMLTFVHDYDHPRSAAGISLDEQVHLIAQGEGNRGSSLFYLRQTLQALAEDGSRDRQAEKLLSMVLNGA